MHSTKTFAFIKQEAYKLTSLKQWTELGGSVSRPSNIIFTFKITHMNQKTIKELKKIINYEKGDSSQTRLLSRLKKQYKGLSAGARPIFIQKLKDMYNN